MLLIVPTYHYYSPELESDAGALDSWVETKPVERRAVDCYQSKMMLATMVTMTALYLNHGLGWSKRDVYQS